MLRLGLALAAMTLSCRGEIQEISSAEHQLGIQHSVFESARASIESPSPDWVPVYTLAGQMDRTVIRMGVDYPLENKAQAIERLAALRDAYRRTVIPLLAPTEAGVYLQPGVSAEHVRAAFGALVEDYRQVRAMTTR